MTNIFSQSIENDIFNISGKIIGKDTGIVVLYYIDPDMKNNTVSANLKNGEFKFTGKVNRVCDAYLWTDTSNHNFSDQTVVRFLLEPKNIDIIYENPNAIIKGSDTQKENENFEKEKSTLLIPKKQIQKQIDSLYIISKQQSTSQITEKIDNLYADINAINAQIKPIDFYYIRSNPDSYLSGFLLSTYKRKVPLDTLQAYYILLGDEVKRSSEGRKIIEYLYPLTNDTNFRNKNPLLGPEYNKVLNETKSVYDLSSKDTSGNLVNLNDFKGQYLLIDFWASWCQPCLENFPFMDKLKKNYKSYPIQFIAVSLDTDPKQWKESIEKHNLSGVQLSDSKGFFGILPIFCKVVTSIPRYVLVDKMGKIINFDTPHPMNPELKILIDNLLKKSE